MKPSSSTHCLYTASLIGLLSVLVGTQIYANPVIEIPTAYGAAYPQTLWFPLLYFFPTILVEFGIIHGLLRLPRWGVLLAAVAACHVVSYPLTLVAGVFVGYIAEVVPICTEAVLYRKFFAFARRKNWLDIDPSWEKLYQVSLVANAVTFILGVGCNLYLTSFWWVRHDVPPHILSAP